MLYGKEINKLNEFIRHFGNIMFFIYYRLLYYENLVLLQILTIKSINIYRWFEFCLLSNNEHYFCMQ